MPFQQAGFLPAHIPGQPIGAMAGHKSAAAKRAIFPAIFCKVTRAVMDRLVGHNWRKRRLPHTCSLGDTRDSWKSDHCRNPENSSRSYLSMKSCWPGRLLAFTLHDKPPLPQIGQCAWWHPHGNAGPISLATDDPAQLFIFRGMARRIARLLQNKSQETVLPYSSCFSHCIPT